MDFPTWATDDTSPPAAYRVPMKKLTYAIAKKEWMRLLHNGIHAFVRGARVDVPDPNTGKLLTADQDTILTAVFPGQYPNNPPTAAQAKAWVVATWQPVMEDLMAWIGNARRNIVNYSLSWVTL